MERTPFASPLRGSPSWDPFRLVNTPSSRNAFQLERDNDKVSTRPTAVAVAVLKPPSINAASPTKSNNPSLDNSTSLAAKSVPFLPVT